MKDHKAVLDADKVYRGHEPVAEDFEPGNDDVMVPADCDLEAGRYVWNGTTFLPIKSPEPEDLVNELNTLAAIAVGIEALANGEPLPELTARWIEWYKTTVDAKGRFTAGKGQPNDA